MRVSVTRITSSYYFRSFAHSYQFYYLLFSPVYGLGKFAEQKYFERNPSIRTSVYCGSFQSVIRHSSLTVHLDKKIEHFR